MESNRINFDYHKSICPLPTFSWWQWWSDWSDVCIFNFSGFGYLLQARRNRTGKCQFRVEAMKNIFGTAQAMVSDVMSQEIV